MILTMHERTIQLQSSNLIGKQPTKKTNLAVSLSPFGAPKPMQNVFAMGNLMPYGSMAPQQDNHHHNILTQFLLSECKNVTKPLKTDMRQTYVDQY